MQCLSARSRMECKRLEKVTVLGVVEIDSRNWGVLAAKKEPMRFLRREIKVKVVRIALTKEKEKADTAPFLMKGRRVRAGVVGKLDTSHATVAVSRILTQRTLLLKRFIGRDHFGQDEPKRMWRSLNSGVPVVCLTWHSSPGTLTQTTWVPPR